MTIAVRRQICPVSKLPETINLDKSQHTLGENPHSRVQLQLRIMQPQVPIQRQPANPDTTSKRQLAINRGLNFLFTETIVTPTSISMDALTRTNSPFAEEPPDFRSLREISSDVGATKIPKYRQWNCNPNQSYERQCNVHQSESPAPKRPK